MVLFKRKPVHFLPRPPIEDDSSEVWVIPETSEVFTDYETYLQRMDFYKQRRFICEITGHSQLTFFDALKSETAGSREVDSAFPDALREPVLRKVQFKTTSRIDALVDEIFDEFKQDFFPGEVVTVVLDDGQRVNGLIREKAKFNAIPATGLTAERRAFSKYIVKLIGKSNEDALVNDEHVVRDRKIFTKQILRSFIKNTVTRESWTGAPWLVKPKFAQEYRISTDVPPELQFGHRLAEKRANAAKKTEQDGMFGVWPSQQKLPELKPALKGGRKSQLSPEELAAIKQENYDEYQRAMQGDPTFAMQGWGQAIPPGYPGHVPMDVPYAQQNGYYYPVQQSQMAKNLPRLPPPPPVKYPIEDLEVPPVRDGTHRPALKFLSNEGLTAGPAITGSVPGLNQDSVGITLETWNTLNVYCQELKLDSFTFDDFADAMGFSSDDVECELFVEIHCAVLKRLVNAENDEVGAIQISLPDLPESEDEGESSVEDHSRLPTPTPEPEILGKRNTRSSLNKVQNASDTRDMSRSATADIKIHRAPEMFENDSWIQKLRRRDFHDGGWQLIMVGLLHQLAGRARLRNICEGILTHLAPLDAEPTQETARVQYSTMNINLRIQALQTVCMLLPETKAFKVFLEECSNQMTQLRKVKIEHQRARKDAIAQLKILNEERRQLQPEEKSPTPIPELEDGVEAIGIDDADISIADSEDDEPLTSRALRRGNDRAAERKRKREEEQDRKEKAAEAKQNKGSKEYQKVLKAIDKERDKIDDAEEHIAIIDGDLREADCPRTRVLGKDRFWNRYYWFERNAMPHGGLPESSTAHAEYANARIWVQGPDDLERLGFVDVTEHEKAMYFRRFQFTPPERKKLEEGPTSVHTALQWGYYDTPEEVDMLIGWLDGRGVRELKLKKELNQWRDVIIHRMEKRHEYLTPPEDDDDLPAVRMSTRTKTYVSESSHRCLKWKNNMALAELGHKHVDLPPKPRGRGRKAAVVTAVEEDKGITTRGQAHAAAAAVVLNRQGKPVSRQGTRYHF